MNYAKSASRYRQNNPIVNYSNATFGKIVKNSSNGGYKAEQFPTLSVAEQPAHHATKATAPFPAEQED